MKIIGTLSLLYTCIVSIIQVHDIKESFNSKLLGLRDKKIKLIDEVSIFIVRCISIWEEKHSNISNDGDNGTQKIGKFWYI